MLSTIHHVGHLTARFDRTLAYYRDTLGGEVAVTTDVDGKVDVAFVEWPDLRIELVSRTERGTYLDELLDALEAESPYHLAVVVDDIAESAVRLEERGIPMFDEEPVDGLGPYRRAFADPDAVPGLPIELIELEG